MQKIMFNGAVGAFLRDLEGVINKHSSEDMIRDLEKHGNAAAIALIMMGKNINEEYLRHVGHIVKDDNGASKGAA